MKQIKSSKVTLIRPVIVLPKDSCGAHLDSPEKRQAFYKLQDEIWRAFLKALEKPIKQLHSKQHRIVEVLGAIRFYINHNTGEIDLRVRVRAGNTEAAFEMGNPSSYNLDLPLYDINLVVEAFTASWNQELLQADKDFKASSPMQYRGLRALFCGAGTFYYRLTTSIRKAVQKTVLWQNLRHQVRDALKIEPEVINIARRARAVRKVKHQPNLDIDHFNSVMQNIKGYRQLNKEASNLLWLYTIALEEKVIPKGELVQALKKMLVYYSGCRERGWRLVCSSNIRDFEPALETNGNQWDLLVEYIKLHNLLDRNQAIPRKALHLFNEPYWIVNNKNKIFYRGVEVKPALLNSYINEVINTENIEEFSQSEAVPVFTWLFDAKPQLDKNQLKKGWPWLFKEATKWLEDNATEAQLTAIQWECKLGAVTLGQYQFVPLINTWYVRQEALRNRHCADQYIENCRAGTYRLYSVYYNNKHRATLGVEFENRRWEVHQIKSFANQSVSIELHCLADLIAEGLNLVNEGSDDRGKGVERHATFNEDIEDADNSDGYNCSICGEECGSCGHLVACFDRFGARIVGGAVHEKRDELLTSLTGLFELSIRDSKSSELSFIFDKILAKIEQRALDGETVADILYECDPQIDAALLDLICRLPEVMETSWEYDGMPGMSTIYDCYWAKNPDEVISSLHQVLNRQEVEDLSVNLTKEDVQLAEQFWNDEGVPLLRQANGGESVLIVGWSLGQDKEVLLSREVGEDEDYGEAAAEAEGILDKYLPVNFTCDGEVLAELSTGFHDLYGEWYSEVTFDEPWYVTILQGWLDTKGAQICIRPSKSIEEDKLILDHVARASYSIDNTMRYASFQHMSIQYAIKKFASEHWKMHKALPIGQYNVNGTDVNFM
jgi:hypothetical protein